MPEPKITCASNGPYLVQDVPTLQNSHGEKLPSKTKIALCRCGGSSNKPFCDGTHAKLHFSSERQTQDDLNKRQDYVGVKLTVHDNRAICSHAGYCTDRLKQVFRMGEEPWIDPNGADAKAIIETIRQCPSGALTYSINGVEFQNEGSSPAITISKNGPYSVKGKINLIDPSGLEPPSKENYTLCRCGASKNKPFCDGSHWSVKFQDEKN